LGSTDQVRSFFALWPTPDQRADLVQASQTLHRRHGGRVMAPDSLHLTLVFVGQVPLERLPDLMAVGSQQRSPAFDATLDRFDCWRHNRIGCLEAGAVPEGMLALVRGLEAGLRATGLTFDARPYRPHVTLLRNADCRMAPGLKMENPAPEPVLWSARDFVLVRSSLRPEGARYVELGRWPLL
jgi:RNA 2',3'-cyclic 3'-phosphodiesterase